MVEIIKSDVKNKFAKFKEQYQHLYSKEAWQYIEDYFFEQLKEKDAPDILMQIYSELKINPSPARFYHRHLRLIKKLFPLDGNIIEIGSGMIPAFANLVANEQRKIKAGTITLYEPLLLPEKPKYSNMTFHKETFTTETDLTNYDLVLGIMPCEATESILENAIKSRKDFYVAMCGCVHSPLSYFYGYYSISPELYQSHVINNAIKLSKEYDNGEIEVTRLKNTELDYPILYNRRR